MMRVALIRHGKTEGNRNRQFIGSTDPPLCQEGITELKRAKERRCYPEVEAVYVSPMKRCLQTAEILYPNCPFNVCEELRECDFGILEGKTHQEMENDPIYQAFLNQSSAAFPGGEHPERFQSRCQEEFQRILSDAQKKNISSFAVVCHGGTIMSILSKYDREEKGFYQYQTENGGGFLLESENGPLFSVRGVIEINRGSSNELE